MIPLGIKLVTPVAKVKPHTTMVSPSTATQPSTDNAFNITSRKSSSPSDLLYIAKFAMSSSYLKAPVFLIYSITYFVVVSP